MKKKEKERDKEWEKASHFDAGNFKQTNDDNDKNNFWLLLLFKVNAVYLSQIAFKLKFCCKYNVSMNRRMAIYNNKY